MDTARNRANGKPLENNTRLFDRGDHFAVRLHNTDVVRIYPDGWSLHTEGYSSLTTKDRLNKYSPVRIFQRDFVWYVQDGWKNEEPRYFIEGLFIDKNWKVWDGRDRYHYHLEHQAQVEDTSGEDE